MLSGRNGVEPVPKGPRGEKRPADAIARAVMVAKIATGEIVEELDKPKSAAAELGAKGGKARARVLTPDERRSVAQKGARARWKAFSDGEQ